ncbi:hypothetical protein B0I22_0173 [Epilithonimonas xixisoli]|uniref:Uncharacterized protein n=1 Tax=Epilithonimonas xixisoli TaxID=1476462 RepID=A0A4R8I7U3_9FLAO|nr:hypothetical protein B0I22_0173 [Epilithonimonas xixisoli]
MKISLNNHLIFYSKIATTNENSDANTGVYIKKYFLLINYFR